MFVLASCKPVTLVSALIVGSPSLEPSPPSRAPPGVKFSTSTFAPYNTYHPTAFSIVAHSTIHKLNIPRNAESLPQPAHAQLPPPHPPRHGAPQPQPRDRHDDAVAPDAALLRREPAVPQDPQRRARPPRPGRRGPRRRRAGVRVARRVRAGGTRREEGRRRGE